MKRYVCEFDFRYNHRGLTDAERTVAALRGIEGKRLTYRGTSAAEAAMNKRLSTQTPRDLDMDFPPA